MTRRSALDMELSLTRHRAKADRDLAQRRYPVGRTNKNYKMLYFNMGHNDIDYPDKYDNTNKAAEDQQQNSGLTDH